MITTANPDCKIESEFYRLAYEFEQQKLAMGFLQAQVQALTHRLNCLSDKVSDQAVVLSKLID